MSNAGARPYIGGQAVLEGVMMRAPRSFAVVVRRRDGSLSVRERAMTEGPGGLRRWPLVRGVMSLVESLKLGGEALRFSVDQMERDLSGAVTATLTAFGLTLLSLVTRADGESASSAGGGRRAGTWL